jgi:hypothetical protein
MGVDGTIGNQVRYIFDAGGHIIGYRNPVTDQDEPALSAAQIAGLAAGHIVDADGGVFALSEAQPVQTLTATGTAVAGACEFRGIVVRALSGTPQTATVYDATSASGTPVAVFTLTAPGAYYWDGDWATPGNGRGGRRINTAGCHVVITGGTSRTIDVMAG